MQTNRTLKRITSSLILLVSLLITNLAIADTHTFLSDNEIFIEIENPNREAEAWAVCSASLDILAEIVLEDSPAQAKEISQQANGASVAIAMSIIMDGIDEEKSPEQVSNMMKFAATQMTSLVDVQGTAILSELEMMSKSSQTDKFMDKLGNTAVVCTKNLEAQQMYIDMWREMAKSGLFP